MKVLLTGANGFVGSHILECLRQRALPAAVLLRATGNRQFIEPLLTEVEVRPGSIADLASLREAVRDVTHVIHCAGVTKVPRPAEFFAVNQQGTANLVAALNERGGQVQRLVYISSLAAAGPAVLARPARESDPPAPVSDYGRSKLAAECEITERCRSEFVILRPPGVYGPRDTEFLRLFRAVRGAIVPDIARGAQELSLVYVTDLAQAVVDCLEHPRAAGHRYNVAAPEVLTARQFTDEVVRAMACRPWRVSLPGWVVRGVGAVATAHSRVFKQASVLAHDKYRELLAPGWVCDSSRLRDELGLVCSTGAREGIRQTLSWYRAHHWL